MEETAFVYLCPSKESATVKEKRKINVKILPSFCHALRAGLVNCCQIKKTERKTAVVALYKKKNTFSRSQVGRVPIHRITQLLLKDLHLKDGIDA